MSPCTPHLQQRVTSLLDWFCYIFNVHQSYVAAELHQANETMSVMTAEKIRKGHRFHSQRLGWNLTSTFGFLHSPMSSQAPLRSSISWAFSRSYSHTIFATASLSSR